MNPNVLADELDRLHELNAELVAALRLAEEFLAKLPLHSKDRLTDWTLARRDYSLDRIKAALAKAESK